MTNINFFTGNYLLYDDDCGICTKFSRLIGKLLHTKTTVLPMHLDRVEKEGMREIPEDYWKSFHIVKDGRWYTEGAAIVALASLFPFGLVFKKIATFPPIYAFLMFFLRTMQYQRKMECTINF